MKIFNQQIINLDYCDQRINGALPRYKEPVKCTDDIKQRKKSF